MQISQIATENLPGSLRTEGRWVDALLWLLALPISGLAGGALVFDSWKFVGRETGVKTTFP